MTKDATLEPIDICIGNRVKVRRKSMKMSQTELGKRTGITFQQVQKYEKGVNRISAGRLLLFAQALGVDVDYFFDGLENPERVALADGTQTLLLYYVQIKDMAMRRKLAALVRTLATEEGADETDQPPATATAEAVRAPA